MAKSPEHGRCKDIKHEESAKKLCLPMCNKFSGTYIKCVCHDEMILREVDEQIMRYQCKRVHCPIYYQNNCKEEVEIAQFKDHIEKKHPNNIFYDNILNKEIGMHESTVDLLNADSEDFLVYILQSHIFVGCLGPVRKYNKYNVQIYSNLFRNKLLSYKNQDIVEFDERLHCYKCKRGMCTFKHHSFSMNKNRDFLLINRNVLLEFFPNATTILIRVTLVCDSTRSKAEKQQKLFHNSSVICKSLRCNICSEYMLDKVYGCHSGYLICEQCRTELINYQNCENRLTDVRCLLAEILSKDIQLACQTARCDFVGNLKELSFHEKQSHPSSTS